MHPSRGAARTPLDMVLGAVANVQILRVLAAARAPIGRSEAARRAGITPQGGRKAIHRLLETGLLELVGSGATQQVKLNAAHPLAGALIELFERERSRFKDFLGEIRSALDSLDPAPVLVWVEGSVAEGTDDFGDPLVLSLLAEPQVVGRVSEALRDRLVEIESRFEITVEVRILTGAELMDETAAESPTMLPFWRPEPAGQRGAPALRQGTIHDQSALDSRFREQAEHVAGLLLTDPELRDRALDHVRGRLAEAAAGAEAELREWERILESMSLARLRQFLRSDSDRAVRLRRDLPFWNILRREERDAEPRS